MGLKVLRYTYITNFGGNLSTVGEKKALSRSQKSTNVAFFLLFPPGENGKGFLLFSSLISPEEKQEKVNAVEVTYRLTWKTSPERRKKQEKRKQKPKGRIPKVRDVFCSWGSTFVAYR